MLAKLIHIQNFIQFIEKLIISKKGMKKSMKEKEQLREKSPPFIKLIILKK